MCSAGTALQKMGGNWNPVMSTTGKWLNKIESKIIPEPLRELKDKMTPESWNKAAMKNGDKSIYDYEGKQETMNNEQQAAIKANALVEARKRLMTQGAAPAPMV